MGPHDGHALWRPRSQYGRCPPGTGLATRESGRDCISTTTTYGGTDCPDSGSPGPGRCTIRPACGSRRDGSPGYRGCWPSASGPWNTSRRLHCGLTGHWQSQSLAISDFVAKPHAASSGVCSSSRVKRFEHEPGGPQDDYPGGFEGSASPTGPYGWPSTETGGAQTAGPRIGDQTFSWCWPSGNYDRCPSGAVRALFPGRRPRPLWLYHHGVTRYLNERLCAHGCCPASNWGNRLWGPSFSRDICMGLRIFLLEAGAPPGQCSPGASCGDNTSTSTEAEIGIICTVSPVPFCKSAACPHPFELFVPIRQEVQEPHWAIGVSCADWGSFSWKRHTHGFEGVVLFLLPWPDSWMHHLAWRVFFCCAHNIRIGCSGAEATDWTFLDSGHVPTHCHVHILLERLTDLRHWLNSWGWCSLTPSFCTTAPPWSLEVDTLPLPAALDSYGSSRYGQPEAFSPFRPWGLPFSQPQQALNTCIGSSGARAAGCWEELHNSDWVHSAFDNAINLAEAFSHSWALAILIILLALLFRPFGLPASPLGLLCGMCFLGVQRRPLVSLAVASPQVAVLDWSPWKNRHGKIPRNKVRPNPSAVCFLWSLIFWSLPVSVSSVRFLPSVWILLPAAHAMTRPDGLNDPPGLPYSQRSPHLIPPDELTTHVGCCEYPLH